MGSLNVRSNNKAIFTFLLMLVMTVLLASSVLATQCDSSLSVLPCLVDNGTTLVLDGGYHETPGNLTPGDYLGVITLNDGATLDGNGSILNITESFQFLGVLINPISGGQNNISDITIYADNTYPIISFGQNSVTNIYDSHIESFNSNYEAVVTGAYHNQFNMFDNTIVGGVEFTNYQPVWGSQIYNNIFEKGLYTDPITITGMNGVSIYNNTFTGGTFDYEVLNGHQWGIIELQDSGLVSLTDGSQKNPMIGWRSDVNVGVFDTLFYYGQWNAATGDVVINMSAVSMTQTQVDLTGSGVPDATLVFNTQLASSPSANASEEFTLFKDGIPYPTTDACFVQGDSHIECYVIGEGNYVLSEPPSINPYISPSTIYNGIEPGVGGALQGIYDTKVVPGFASDVTFEWFKYYDSVIRPLDITGDKNESASNTISNYENEIIMSSPGNTTTSIVGTYPGVPTQHNTGWLYSTQYIDGYDLIEHFYSYQYAGNNKYSNTLYVYYYFFYEDGTVYQTPTQTSGRNQGLWKTWTNIYPEKPVKEVRIYHYDNYGNNWGTGHYINQVQAWAYDPYNTSTQEYVTENIAEGYQIEGLNLSASAPYGTFTTSYNIGGGWVEFNHSEAQSFDRTEDLKVKFTLGPTAMYIDGADFDLKGMKNEDLYDYTFTDVEPDTVLYTSSTKGDMTGLLKDGEVWSLKVTESYNPTFYTYSEDVTVATSPSVEFVSLDVDRASHTATYCFNVTDLNNETSVNAAVEYAKTGEAFTRTTPVVVSTVPTQVCENIDLEYGNTYTFKGMAYVTAAGYTAPSIYYIPPIEGLYAGPVAIEDIDNRERQYCDGPYPCFDVYGYREGALYESDEIYIETAIELSGLTVHWYDGSSWTTHPMNTNGIYSYLTLTGLSGEGQTFYITSSNSSTVFEWTKPGTTHLAGADGVDTTKYVGLSGEQENIDYRLMYLGTEDYDTTAYEWCLDDTGDDIYQCYNTGWWNSLYDIGQLDRGGIIGPGIKDTGVLSSSLDTNRPYSTDYERYEFGGQNTGLVDDEYSDTNSIVPYYIYVNYTKPPGARIEESRWYVKHSFDNNTQSPIDDYIVIPQDCWDHAGTYGELEFRVKSEGHSVLANLTTEPACYDGAVWVPVGNPQTGAVNHEAEYTADPEARLVDGDYRWGVTWKTDTMEWYWAGNSYARIYEERMIWDIEGLIPSTQYWWDDSTVVNSTIDNYYVHFWMNDEFNRSGVNEPVNFEYVDLFKWGHDETDVYDYWRENNNTLWIKTDLVAGETYTFIIGDDEDFTYTEKGDDVFLLYEDFRDVTVNTELEVLDNWLATDVEDAAASYIIGAEGAFYFYDEDSNDVDYYTTVTEFDPGVVLEVYSKDDPVGQEWPLSYGFFDGVEGVGRVKDIAFQDYYKLLSRTGGVDYYNDANVSKSLVGNATYNKYKIVWTPSKAMLIANDVVEFQVNEDVPTSALPVALGNLNTGGTAGWDTLGRTEYLFVRQYSETEPTVTCEGNVCEVYSPVTLTDYQLDLQTDFEEDVYIYREAFTPGFNAIERTKLDSDDIFPGYTLPYWRETNDDTGEKLWTSVSMEAGDSFTVKITDRFAYPEAPEDIFVFYDGYDEDYQGTGSLDVAKWANFNANDYHVDSEAYPGKLLYNWTGGAWDNRGPWTTANFVRTADYGYVLEFDYEPLNNTGSHRMMGWHDTTASDHYQYLIYGIYDNNGVDARIYEDNVARAGTYTPFERGVNHKVRITAKDTTLGGAKYEVSRDGGVTWDELYNSSYSVEATMKIGSDDYGVDYVQDSMRIRKHYEEEPISVVCADNECVFTATEDVVDYQVMLTTDITGDLNLIKKQFTIQEPDYFADTATQTLVAGYKEFTPIELKDDYNTEVYDFGMQVYGSNTNQRLGKYQPGFILFNLPSDEVLQVSDSDGDGLNDYEELYVYYTNPKSADSDEGGENDREEIVAGRNPLLYFDDVVEVNDVIINELYPEVDTTLSCSFNVTNDDTYNNIDVGVSWLKAEDNNEWFSKYIDTPTLVDETKSNTLFTNESNGTVSYSEVPAPYTHMFTDGGVGRTYSTGWRLVTTINSPPIPAPYDVEKLYMYQYGYTSKYYTTVYSYTRWYYKDGTAITNTGTQTNTLGAWKTHTNPHPGAEVDYIEVYGHDNYNYGWYINQIQVWGKNGFDGFDLEDDNFITENLLTDEVDRFRLSYDLEGGVTTNYYDTDDDYENKQLAYYTFQQNVNDEYLNELHGTQANESYRADRFGVDNNSLYVSEDLVNLTTVGVVPDNVLLNEWNDFSIIIDTNLDSLPTTSAVLVEKDGNFRVSVDNAGRLEFYTGDDWLGTELISANTITPGTDYEIVATYDGRSKNIYLNGVVDPNLRTVDDDATTGTNTTDLVFGGHWNGTAYDELINGSIDAVHLYEVGMTQDDVSHYRSVSSIAEYDVWNDWTDFKSNEEITIVDTDYLRLMVDLDETEPRLRQIKFDYHPTKVYVPVNDYDYTFYNINRGELYTTTNTTGSFTGSLEDYGQYKCSIDVFNQNVHKRQDSEKASVYPLENLNVTLPDLISIDNEPFFTSFSVTDYDGGLVCNLNANGVDVGSYGHIETDKIYDDLGLTVTFHYSVTEMAMSQGCLGDITLAPVSEYPLEICLEDQYGTTVPGSCNVYDSGEYGPGEVLSTGEIDRVLLLNSDKFRFKFNWQRIGYVAMANPELDGNFDHGQSEFGDHNHVCQRLDDDADLVCGGDRVQYFWADTLDACEHGGGDEHGDMVLDYGDSFTDSYQLYSTNTCAPGTEITNNYTEDNMGYYSTTTERRVYEGYWRTGGTDAALSCIQAAGQSRNYDCGQCDTFNLRYVPTSCVEGVEDTFPAGLCTYSGNTTDVSDYFTYQDDFDNGNIVFTDKLQAKGDISWTSTSNWPVIDDDYSWNITCSAIGQDYNVTSDTRVYKYDLQPPTINTYGSNENLLFPEIGDTIVLSVNVEDDDTVAFCTLFVDDNGDGMQSQSNYTVDYFQSDVDMSFQVRPYSIKDSIVHPDYFRTGNIVWTKLSMENGSSITLVMDNTDNVYDTYPQAGNDVFEFFEPFDSNPIDSEVWTDISTESTTLTYGTGELTFYDEDSSNKDYYISEQLFTQPAILEFSQKDYTAEEWPLEVAFGRGTSNTIGKLKNPLTQDNFIFKTYKYGITSESPNTVEDNNYAKYKVVWKDGESTLWKDDALLHTLTTNIPTEEVPITFGDTTGIGTAGTDTKGTIDWMFVRKYSDNMPTVTCDANICLITADNGGFDNLQIPLETTYTTGDISLAYAEDNSEVSWTAVCYDDAGNEYTGATQTFDVKDNTAPLIQLDEDNAFKEDNLSTHSNAVRDLDLAVNYFDYNLFQAYEAITCDYTGLIYEWEDIDVEVFNFNPTYQNTVNQTSAYDVYDDTFSVTTLNPTGDDTQGWTGQIFDSFYYVSELEYKADVQDSALKIETYNGVSWSPVKTYTATTGTHNDTIDINASINGIRFYFDGTSTVDAQNKVYYMKYIYQNGLSQNGALFQHTHTVDTTGLPMQRCVFDSSASDDHTDEEIADYEITELNSGLEYETDVDVSAQITYKGNEYDVLSKSTIKQTDRYTFEFDFVQKSLSRTFTLKSTDNDIIYHRPNSKYEGHFVIWDDESKDGNWVDFVEIANPDREFDYSITKISDYEFDITVSVVVPSNNLTPEQELATYGVDTMEFQSIGGTNVATETWEFYIGGAVDVTGVNVFDQSNFTNYTVHVSTVDSYPGATYNQTFNVSEQNYVEGLSEGVYDLLFTHDQFFDQTYRINITSQFDDCYQESADIGGNCSGTIENTIEFTNNGSYSDDPGWNNLGNAIDANWSSYSSVTNTVGYKYYYFTYDMVPEAGPIWELGVGENSTDRINATPQDDCLDDADGKLKLRVGYENSIVNQDMVIQCSNDGAWSNINTIEGPTNFTNKLWEEGVHWYTLGANLQEQNYESYQAKITFQLRDVKTQDLLDDLNMSITIGNFTNSQYFPEGRYDLTVLVDAAEANILATKDRYIDLNTTYTFDYKQEETFVLDMNFYSLINLYDEKTLELFDMTKPDSVEFLVFCEDSTRVQQLTNATQTVEITCAYEKFKFLLTYGTSGYYRTFLTPPEDAFNQSIYLIEISSTSYIYSSFTVDDLLGQYDNPRIYINKLIENSEVQITADYTDVEGKIGAFLIENQEYNIEIRSDNRPPRKMGIYAADVGGDKTLRLYDIDLSQETAGFENNVNYGLILEERDNETYIVAQYTDAETQTSQVTFQVRQGTSEGPVLYTSTQTLDVGQSTVEYEQLLAPEYLNTTLVAVVEVNHEVAGVKSDAWFLHKDFTLPLPADLDRGTLNWIIVLFLSVIAIMSTIRTANIMSMVLLLFGALLVVFGWFEISMGIIILSILVSLLSIMKEGEKKTK